MNNEIINNISHAFTGNNGRLLIAVTAIVIVTLGDMLTERKYTASSKKLVLQAPDNTVSLPPE